jgi:hypothetical protein
MIWLLAMTIAILRILGCREAKLIFALETLKKKAYLANACGRVCTCKVRVAVALDLTVTWRAATDF